MTPHDKAEFAKIIFITAEKYKRAFSNNFLEMYWQSLKEFSLPEIKHAFEAHFNNPDNGHFLPHQSDIIRILQGNSETQALQAWTKVMDAIAMIGAYQSVVFDDLIIHSVIADMEGWTELCRQTKEELKFRGYEFQKRYRGYLLRRPRQYPNRLIGIIEHQNRQHGYSIPSLQFFGDQQAASLTYSEGFEPAQLCAQKVTSIEHVASTIASQFKIKSQNLLTQQEKNNELLRPIVNSQKSTPADTEIKPSTPNSTNPQTRGQSDED